MEILFGILMCVVAGIAIMIFSDEDYHFHTFLLLIMFLVGTCMWSISIAYDGAYKQAQVDAINGKIKYRLEKTSDGTTEWKEINK
jgi:hypothetical protein